MTMTPPRQPALSVLTVPAFKDNYLWLVHDGTHAAVVDPGDAAPVRAALAAHDLRLTAILLTHHHADHIGGVPALLAEWAVPVFGPKNDGIDLVTDPLVQGDRITVPGISLALDVLDVPGHTLGHIAYVRRDADADARWLFCGDTLFGAGCGRLFEGTPAQMAASLAQLAALPDETLVYCAHEYTMSNLAFAQAVDGVNAALAARVQADSASRAAGRPTIPSTIALEKATNPFLRTTSAPIVHSLVAAGRVTEGAAPLEVFTALREWKNTF
jgi:hydroxyacylglutathione hydrolase